MEFIEQRTVDITADLHAHSAYAGGARAGGKTAVEQAKGLRKRFEDSAIYSPLKGVIVLGTGDASFEPWMEFLNQNLEEVADGMFTYLHDDSQTHYLLQSEYIFTAPVGTKRKPVHVVALFPHFDAIDQLNEMFDAWGVSRKKMARPFVTSDSVEELSQRMHQILDIDPGVELIPAHVLTPQGVYGGNHQINKLEQFFGNAASRIHAIETGLSADPKILALIPELDKLTLISNADAHSAALNRVAREFTTYDIQKLSYANIVDTIRRNKVKLTAEFHPTEGRYFLTGHREATKTPPHGKGQYCYFSPQHLPSDGICPICNRKLTVGVLQRAFEITAAQGGDRQIGDGPDRPFITMVPLIEIMAHNRGIKSTGSKRLLKEYLKVIKIVGTESRLWSDADAMKQLEINYDDPELINSIKAIKAGKFGFDPIGYDGTYGQLQIGIEVDYQDIAVINH